MARPRTITDQQILDAARAVFAREGAGAATALVAREAGVSEGTIFRRFATKEHLFRRAMCGGSGLSVALGERVGQGEVREQLAALALDLIEHLRRALPRMMALANGLPSRPQELWREEPDAAPVMTLKAVTNYLDAEMRLGRLAAADPEVVARALLGSAHNYAFFEHMGMHARMPIAAPTFARGIADLLWRGLAVQPAPRGDTVNE